jgi:hypothetical protein
MKSWSPLLIAAALLLGACQSPGPQPPVAVNHVSPTPAPVPTASPTPSSAPPTAAPTAVPTTASGGPDRCHTGGLLISFSGAQGAAGTIVDTFRVANTTTSPCTLYGYVGMLMLDASGTPMPTRVVRGGFFGNQAGPGQFLLQPGTAASFQAAWSDVTQGSETGPCPQAARLEITPPDEFDHVIIPVSGWNLAPCGPGGEISVSPIRAAGAGPS